MEKIFRLNHWTNAWKDDIFDYHHDHSNTHEVLGIYRGSCETQLGGPTGEMHWLEAGDLVFLPAGTAHKRMSATGEFRCVWAYPFGRK